MTGPERDQQSRVSPLRLRRANDHEVRRAGAFVLYWMVANRRTRWNFALERAVEWSRKLERPLLVLEPLRAGYRWASARFHRFAIDGMAANRARCAACGIAYWPYVEPTDGAARGLLEELSREAAIIVTDAFPCFELPRIVAAGARRAHAPVEVVDSNGLLPLAATERAFPTAYAFRRFLQRELPAELARFPSTDPLALETPALARMPQALERWPAASPALLAGGPEGERELAELPIDHAVRPVAVRGGEDAGRAAWRAFMADGLDAYGSARNSPDDDASSGLSPYLHFGHLAAHEVVADLLDRGDWTFDRLADTASGKRSGWWGLDEPSEAFLDQLVTWRELGYNVCFHRPGDYDRFEALPDWARATLAAHERDPREHVYTLEQFERAATHDELWNAAQRQLVREGRIHNYLRMLWGKKVLEWTRTPREALAILIELNNKYALDGRNPNSYTGILWTLGRHDRPWGPERPIFGKVRYMTSANTRRKFPVKAYLERYGERTAAAPELPFA